MLLLDYMRNQVGLAIRGIHGGRNIGWTTDAEKADAARRAGATVAAVNNGWDVSFLIDTELDEAPQ